MFQFSIYSILDFEIINKAQKETHDMKHVT